MGPSLTYCGLDRHHRPESNIVQADIMGEKLFIELQRGCEAIGPLAERFSMLPPNQEAGGAMNLSHTRA
jgi:hypothetical protein